MEQINTIAQRAMNGGSAFLSAAAYLIFFFSFDFLLQNSEKDLEIEEDFEPEAIEDFDDSDSLYSAEVSAEQRNPALAKAIGNLMKRYHPQDAFVLMMDARSGDILAWGQRKDDCDSEEPDFLKRDSFPAASLSKIVTAAAALEDGKSAKSEFPRIGRNSTLYKRQIFPKEDYSGAMITLEEAFARSNNPANGIIGIGLGKDKIRAAADKLGFFSFEYLDSDYELAESSSGFTKRNMASPLQIALAIRKLLFTQPKSLFKEETYEGIRNLFLKVVSGGTARRDIEKSVHGANKKSLYIGGKTGSLDGDSPKGRYDWFAGFAQSREEPDKAVVIVVMQVHGKLRYQHSTIIAGLLINEWAKISF